MCSHIAQGRALGLPRDTDANSVVAANPVMGDLIYAVNEKVCNVYATTFVKCTKHAFNINTTNAMKLTNTYDI